MTARSTVFVSYSKGDRRWLKRLQVHLKPFHDRGDVEIWDDTRLVAGDRWELEIRAAMTRAAASVLLLSADFLASDFVTKYELPSILRGAEKLGTHVIPIFVGPCRLSSHPELAALQGDQLTHTTFKQAAEI